MNNVDRGLVVFLTLSIIIVGFVLENKFTLMHHDHLSILNSATGPSSLKSKDRARIQRIERAINIILTQRNCSSYSNLTNIVDGLVSKLAKFNMIDATSENNVCDVPNDIIPITDEDLEKNQDADSSETFDGRTVISWLCWLGLWIYRLLLASLIGFLGCFGLPGRFRTRDGIGFCQTVVFILVSCIGYFPNVLLDVFGSHCTDWYFPLCIGMSRLLWFMAVCFVNIFIYMKSHYEVGYVVMSIISIIFMYNGIHPMRMLTL